MIQMSMRYAGGALLAGLTILNSCAPESAAAPPAGAAFEVDPSWPQTFPDNWILGQVTGLHVDDRDHVWVVHQSVVLSEAEAGASLDPPISECCVPAPPVIEIDAEGRVVQGWGGPGDGYFWPSSPHGVFVDHEDNVWIGSNSFHQIMKFTRDGRHLMTIGEPEVNEGSNAPDLLGGPAAVFRYPDSDEIFVADGYRNRRVVVYDANTGEYLRHWGAYGERPDDEYRRGERGVDAPPAEQFSTVHGIVGSHDGLLYVADRSNNRVQVFRTDGEFVMERMVAPATLASGSSFSVGLSPDPDQTYLYLADGTNHKVWILRRADLEVVGSFGRGGRQVGQFIRVHNLGVDSQGNVYTGEAADGRRVQRFLPTAGISGAGG